MSKKEFIDKYCSSFEYKFAIYCPTQKDLLDILEQFYMYDLGHGGIRQPKPFTIL